jgi:hypothetical protein
MIGLGRKKEKLVQIDSAHVKGEPGTGYESRGSKGPFECQNCEYYRPSNSSCGQEDMVSVSKQPKTSDGRVKVDPKGCCEYVERIGKEK